MTLRSEALERSEVIAAELRKGGVKAEAYARGPEGDTITIVNTHNDIVKVWAGLAEVTVHPSDDDSFKQATLNITEGGRDIVRTVRVPRNITFRWLRPWDGEKKDYNEGYWSFQGNARLHQQALGRFPVNVPNARYTYEHEKYHLDVHYSDLPETIPVKVTARAPETKLSLLVGMDETRQFISALPTGTFPVTSVSQAHQVLRPAKARRQETKRQGEWFFVPVNKTEKRHLDNIMSNGDALRARSERGTMPRGMFLERGSSHYASAVLTTVVPGASGTERFAVGTVIDVRGNRHEPLVLPSWHKVVRNRERTVEMQRNDTRTAFRPQRGWD